MASRYADYGIPAKLKQDKDISYKCNGKRKVGPSHVMKVDV